MEPVIKSFLTQLDRFAKEQGNDLYVVGGTLRDLLLGVESVDHDFTAHQAAKIARKFASTNKLTAVTLDDTPGRETVRVVISKQAYLDFTEMQGKDIHADLLQRDFSINAMALPLAGFPAGLQKMIDPSNGRADLEAKTVRMVSAKALSDDPLRMLRAFRFAGNLSFAIEPQTLAEIKKQRQHISEVAAERILYEMLLFLKSDNVYPLLESMDECGLLESILPETTGLQQSGIWEDTLRSFRNLNDLISNPAEILPDGETDPAQSLTGKQSLTRLAMLLHGVDYDVGMSKTYLPPRAEAALHRLRMSNADADFILRSLKYQKEALETKLGFAADPVDESLLYRFAREAQNELLPALFLACAVDRNLTPHARRTADFYFRRYLKAREQKGFLNGNDLMRLFNLSPGPLIRVILDQVEEARVLGTITSREEAEKMAGEIIASN